MDKYSEERLKKLRTSMNIFIVVNLLIILFLNKLIVLKIMIAIYFVIFILFSKENYDEYLKINKEHKYNEDRYISSIEAMNGSVWEWNEKNNTIHISNKIRNRLGIEKNELTLDEWYSYIHEDDNNRVKNYFNDICLNKVCGNANIEYSVINTKGEKLYLRYSGRGIIRDDIYHLAGIIKDITKEKQNELKIHFMNYYDNITGVPNRRMFSEKFGELIETNKKEQTKLALAFFDIDNFKNINDTYGHEIGDNILMKICERVYEALDERCAFARFGGDEFVIAVSDVVDELEIKIFLENILNNIRKPFAINDKIIYSSISMGVSVYPNDSENLNTLLKTADMAMHSAKEEGKNRYKFFDEEISKMLKRQYDIEKSLRIALEKKEIFMVFQPKVTIDGENVQGFEALVRWISEDLGFVSPAEFIPIAESSGLIIDLGKYIIEESFKKCKELKELTDKKFNIAINISDIQLRENGFIDFIKESLERYDISPEYIQFEITEGVIMQSVARNIELLLELKKLGVTIALDDFGTGYSSLSYLKRLPIDVLKIDKSFVDGIGVDEKSECIAESIIKLSHNLNLKVVAEGVETKAQLGYLEKMKCDIAQGYYFSKPEKFEFIKEMI